MLNAKRVSKANGKKISNPPNVGKIVRGKRATELIKKRMEKRRERS